ncbi:RNA polymerase sigma factor, partial [Candidatus Sumerlaeota bacterium]|nr:RNA polymerase sigma factor [Candidatus Sumerlaeota bacterium]
FDALIDRHFGMVYAIALARLRDPEMAQDLAQEVFLRAFLHLGRLEDPSQFAAWVGRVARNLAIDWLRRGQRASRLLPMVPLEAVPGELVDSGSEGVRETMASQEESHALREAMDQLPPELREVVLLHYSEELSQHEIAERLGLHQSTVSRQLRRALEALRGVLEPVLRREALALRPARQAFTRASLLVAGVAALSESAKAALASAGPMAPLAAAGGGKAAAAAGSTGLLSILTIGGKAMATGKGLVAAGAAIAAVAAGTYVITQGEDSPRRTPGGAPGAIPMGSETSVTRDVMNSLVPEDSQVIFATPALEAVIENSMQFIETSIGEAATNLREMWLDPLPLWEQGGVDVGGAYLYVEPRGTEEGRGSPFFMMSISNPGAHVRELDQNSSRRLRVSGQEVWMGGLSFPERESIPNLATAMVGNVSVQTFGQDSAERLVAALRPHDPSPLVASLEGMPSGSARAVIDVASLGEEFGETVEGLLRQIEEAVVSPQPEMGISFIGLNLWYFREEVRSLLDLAHRVEPVAITAVPLRERLDVNLQFRVGDTTVTPASEPRALSLMTWLPDDAILAFDSGLGGRRGHLFIEGVMRYLARLLLGSDLASQDALNALADTVFTLMFYDSGDTPVGESIPGRVWSDEEIAVAWCRSTGHPLLLRRVLLARPSADDLDGLIESLEANWVEPEGVRLTNSNISISPLPLTYEHVETVSIAGHEIHHLRFSGEALHVERSEDDRQELFQAPLQALMGPIGDVDHWFSHRDGVVILTTEPEPELMGRILRGEGLGLREPFAPIEGGISPLPEGDIAMRLSLGHLLDWFTEFVVRVESEQASEPLREMSRRLLDSERGIWLRVDTVGEGFDARLTLPAEDAFGILGAFVAQRREVVSRGESVTWGFTNDPLGSGLQEMLAAHGVSVGFEVSMRELNQATITVQFIDVTLDAALDSMLSSVPGVGWRREPNGTVIICRIE